MTRHAILDVRILTTSVASTDDWNPETRRAAALRLIARSLARAPADVPLIRAPTGRPIIAGSRVQASISYARPLVAVALARDLPIGIDIEAPVFDDAVARSFFSADERDWIMAEAANRDRRFAELWTCKEAGLKLKGTGLAGDLDAFRFSAGELAGPVRRLNGCVFHPFAVEGVVGTLALEAHVCARLEVVPLSLSLLRE